jgi:predicted secreted protein
MRDRLDLPVLGRFGNGLVELSDETGASRDEEIVAPVGGTFEVRLEGTPTAGFVWEAELPGDGQQLVEQAGTEWRQTAPQSLGGPAVQVFRFRALRRGRATLRFRYRRPWESRPLQERLVPVQIEEPVTQH